MGQCVITCGECGKQEVRFHTAKFCFSCGVPRHEAQEKYHTQRLKAKQRGIDWEFTFDQWIAVWLESGKWDQRGQRVGQYVMARKGDVGPYNRDNVVICTTRDNTRQAHENNRTPRGPVPGARGWSYTRGPSPYQVSLCGRYIGKYATEAEAVAAHAAAVQAMNAEMRQAGHRGFVRADPPLSLSSIGG